MQALNGSGYEWMLLGEDDTLFFVEPLLQMLEEFDPGLPYIITDNFGRGGSSSEKLAPRCLPCHSGDDPRAQGLSQGTLVHLCQHMPNS